MGASTVCAKVKLFKFSCHIAELKVLPSSLSGDKPLGILKTSLGLSNIWVVALYVNLAMPCVALFQQRENNNHRFCICDFESSWRRMSLLPMLMVVNCILTRKRAWNSTVSSTITHHFTDSSSLRPLWPFPQILQLWENFPTPQPIYTFPGTCLFSR